MKFGYYVYFNEVSFNFLCIKSNLDSDGQKMDHKERNNTDRLKFFKNLKINKPYLIDWDDRRFEVNKQKHLKGLYTMSLCGK